MVISHSPLYEPSGRLLGPDQDPTKRVPDRIAEALSRQRSARPVESARLAGFRSVESGDYGGRHGRAPARALAKPSRAPYPGQIAA